MKYCNIHCGSSKKGDIKVLPGSGSGTLEPRSKELWEHGVCVLIEKDFIGNPTDKRVGFLKITLINELGGG